MLPGDIEYKIAPENDINNPLLGVIKRGDTLDIFKFDLIADKLHLMLTIGEYSQVIKTSKIISKSPKELIKHLKVNDNDKLGIPLSLYFNKENFTIYLYTNFCVINESAVEMSFSSGEDV